MLILNIALVIFGGALSAYGIFLRRQNKKDKESLKIYGGFAYFGVVLFVLGIQQIIVEYFTHAYNIFYTITALVIFEIVAHYLLRSGNKG